MEMYIPIMLGKGETGMPFVHLQTAGSLEERRKDVEELVSAFYDRNFFNMSDYSHYNVKRGLRNADGTGVVAGLTKISNVHGYVLDEGERSPIRGELYLRGYNIRDLIDDCRASDRYGFEEISWLLLFGHLPTQEQLNRFNALLSEYRELPTGFAEDLIMKAPSPDVMNKLARSVLGLYSYDPDAEDTSLPNIMRQSIELIARMPTIMAQAYQVKRRFYDNKSMYLHIPKDGLSTAENILRMLRSDKQYTQEEAHLLDICMMLHADHGGGNNSTFACRVLSSSGTDTYSAIAAAVGSLKGPRHGGANAKVVQMLDYIKRDVENPHDDGQLTDYICKLLTGTAGDGSGKVYGMGHAVYTLSDPRAEILKDMAMGLAAGTPYESDFDIMDRIERLTPGIFAEKKGSDKPLCANVDLYSGLVYRMLQIPPEVFTPLFAVSRIPGWCAHRIEEVFTCNRIIRPAYKTIQPKQAYIPLAERSGEAPAGETPTAVAGERVRG